MFVTIRRRFVGKYLNKNNINLIFKVAFPIVFLGLLIVCIRGGFKKFPINASWSYYTTKPLLNQSAVNSSWNFIKALTESEEIMENPYIFFDEQTEKKLVNSLYADSDSTAFILTNN